MGTNVVVVVAILHAIILNNHRYGGKNNAMIHLITKM